MDAEYATPVDTQTCVVRRLLENAFLLKGKSNQIQDCQSNRLDPALNYTSSTTLSYGTVVQGGLN